MPIRYTCSLPIARSINRSGRVSSSRSLLLEDVAVPDILSRITTKRNDETRDHPGRTLHHIFQSISAGSGEIRGPTRRFISIGLAKCLGRSRSPGSFGHSKIEERRIWNWRLSRNPQPACPCLYGVKLWRILQHSFGKTKRE